MNIGIAFAGGGVRGAAHLGILQALEEAGIVASCYAGTSAGSIVATMKALGHSNADCLNMMAQADASLVDVAVWDIIKSIPHKFSTLEGLLKGEKLQEFLMVHIGKRFLWEPQKPLSIVSTDVNTGTQVIFSNQFLSKRDLRKLDDRIKAYDSFCPLALPYIVYASCALPGVFRPYNYGKMTLTDGSSTNNLPANLLPLMGADKVIAINLTQRNPRMTKVKGVFNVLSQAATIMIEQNEFLSVNSTKDLVYLNPDLTDVGILDFDKVKYCYDEGYRYGKKIVPQVKAQLGL
jgi:NTE family protein